MGITIYEIAKLSGVSPRTVTRAFQKGSVVNEETRNRILKIAAENNYRPNHLAGRIQGKELKIGVVIDSTVPTFAVELGKGILSMQKQLADMKTSITLKYCHSKNEKDGIILGYIQESYDGIITTGGDMLSLEAEEAIISSGIPYVALTFDTKLQKQICYINDNSYLRGQMAGELFSMLLPSKRVAVFSGNTKEHLHQEIIRGFTEQSKRYGFTIADVYDTADEPEIARSIIRGLLKEELQFDGVFFTTANSASVIEELIKAEKRPLIIASDIYPEMSEFIKSGVVSATLYQNPYRQAKTAVSYLYSYLTEQAVPPEKEFIIPHIVIKSNLCEYETNSNNMEKLN